jgi:hypothetical protein
MANLDVGPPVAPPAPITRPFSPLGAFLSYLVPGLGQIVQGRVAKGLLFLVCLYGLFFFGMSLDNWSNVYVPESFPPREGQERGRWLDAVTDRARFAGQFWIGIVAWPAIAQHLTRPSDAPEHELRKWREGDPPHRIFGTFMRVPNEDEVNKRLQGSDKKPDLGWMYTVIAGVLNILVIYDAFAGPAFGAAPPKPTPPEESEEKPSP